MVMHLEKKGGMTKLSTWKINIILNQEIKNWKRLSFFMEIQYISIISHSVSVYINSLLIICVGDAQKYLSFEIIQLRPKFEIG